MDAKFRRAEGIYVGCCLNNDVVFELKKKKKKNLHLPGFHTCDHQLVLVVIQQLTERREGHKYSAEDDAARRRREFNAFQNANYTQRHVV